ncbi:hypothetical protein [Nocardioides sp. YIM 152588]|uniref:hypothetical protein n=1 Tax=Nocardioides sp. YIM 152588 TaxID=3158259 RepID=UPI0032E4E596
MTHNDSPGDPSRPRPTDHRRLSDRWPVLAGELRDALTAAREPALASQVDDLVVVQSCGCGDDFCQSFYTAPRPRGPWGPGHRNLELAAPWRGLLILDVLDDRIVYVEVLDRHPVT